MKTIYMITISSISFIWGKKRQSESFSLLAKAYITKISVSNDILNFFNPIETYKHYDFEVYGTLGDARFNYFP